jgi:hypothetical protein
LRAGPPSSTQIPEAGIYTYGGLAQRADSPAPLAADANSIDGTVRDQGGGWSNDRSMFYGLASTLALPHAWLSLRPTLVWAACLPAL